MIDRCNGGRTQYKYFYEKKLIQGCGYAIFPGDKGSKTNLQWNETECEI